MPNYLSENIRFLRRKMGKSQTEFAELFELNRGNISSYESGTEPNFDTLEKMVNYFDLPLDDLAFKKLNENNISNHYSRNSRLNNVDNCNDCKELSKLLAAKDEIIKSQDETIFAQKELIKMLREKIT